MSGCRSLTSALYCWRISALRLAVLRVEDLERPPLGRRQPALRPAPGALAGVQRRLVAEKLHRVVEAEALPGPPLGVRLGAGRAPRRRRTAGSGGPRPGRRRTAAPGRRRNGSRRSSTSGCTRARGRGRTSGTRRGCPGDFGARNLPGRAQPGRSQVRSEVSTAPENPRARARRFLSAVTEMSKSKGERRLMGRPILRVEATRALEFKHLPRRAKARRRGEMMSETTRPRPPRRCARKLDRGLPARPASR